MRRNFLNIKGIPHSDQSGTREGEKRCTKCGVIQPFANYTPGVGYGNRRSQCHTCENARRKNRRGISRDREISRRAQERATGYYILFDPTRTFLGFIRGYDFKETLRCGYWPCGMIVHHEGKLYEVKGERLHEADSLPARLRTT
jgi:hypothetical protein